MRNNNHTHKLERGQVIVIVAISLFALLALAVLILDGGALLLNRRTAQNAADAGALAGARVFCRQNTYDAAEIEAEIHKYTISNNQADDVQWRYTNENMGTIDGLKKGEIEVTATVSHGAFFSRIFGEDTLSASATAAGGCFSYGARTVLPIAFPCNVPVRDDMDGVDSSDDCDYSMITWEKFEDIALNTCNMPQNPIYGTYTPTEGETDCLRNYLNANYLDISYIVVNSEKYCANDPDIPEDEDPNNIIVCDLFENEDDAHYQLTSSQRGWLNLTGENLGTSTMVNWINGINPPSIKTHVWLSFIGGNRENTVFGALDGIKFQIVWIPVFNWICPESPNTYQYPQDPTTGVVKDCYDEAHTNSGVGVPLGPDDTCYVIGDSPNRDFGHVVAYAPFFITCVRTNEGFNPNDPFPIVDDECKGFELAFNTNIPEGIESIKDAPLYDASSSVEGYFIQPLYLENPEQINPYGADLGIYGAQLTR